MRRLGLLLAIAATACNGPGGGAGSGGEASPGATPSPAPATTAAASPAPSASPSSNGARSVVEETDDFLFEYAYPVEAGRIPELAALLDRRLEGLRARLASESADARREARADGFPYNKHSAEVTWSTVADLPGWLSLSAERSSYGGGAHGNYFFDSLLWDKEAGRAVAPLALFQSPDALDEALQERLCAALNAEREERRGEPVTPDTDDTFDDCVPVEDTTVLVGSSNRRTFDRLTFQIAPYVAGPYAEGSYEFDFPVDAVTLAAVKPGYRDAFSARN